MNRVQIQAIECAARMHASGANVPEIMERLEDSYGDNFAVLTQKEKRVIVWVYDDSRPNQVILEIKQ